MKRNYQKSLDTSQRHRELIGGVTECLSTLGDGETVDAEVHVGDRIFPCHKTLLRACSGYFRSLWASSGRADQQANVVRLTDDVPEEVFDLILTTLYTGQDLVNGSNVMRVLQGANYLQIPFLIESCENFLRQRISLETFENMYQLSNLCTPQNLKFLLREFMLKNFVLVRDTKTFLELPYDELLALVASDDLVTPSEDLVLRSIFKWILYDPRRDVYFDCVSEPEQGHVEPYDPRRDVFFDCVSGTEQGQDEPFSKMRRKDNDFGDQDCARLFDDGTNEDDENSPSCSYCPDSHSAARAPSSNRSQYLCELLRASRLCLASDDYISELYTSLVIRDDDKAKSIIAEAVNYKCQDVVHAYWPPGARHRKCANVVHVGIVFDGFYVKALCLEDKTWFNLQRRKWVEFHMKCAVFGEQLFVVNGAPDVGSLEGVEFRGRISEFKQKKVRAVVEVTERRPFLHAHGQYLYMICSDSGNVYTFEPQDMAGTGVQLDDIHLPSPRHALSFGKDIIIFCSPSEGQQKTGQVDVYTLDTLTTELSFRGKFTGQADGMASFRDASRCYFLQSNGDLCSVSKIRDNHVSITFLVKMWHGSHNVLGAFLYKSTLFVGTQGPLPSAVVSSYPGVFDDIHLCQLPVTASNFVYYVMPRCNIRKKISGKFPKEAADSSDLSAPQNQIQTF